MHNALAFEVPWQRLAATHLFLAIYGARARGGVVILVRGIVAGLGSGCRRLPRLPSRCEQGQLIFRKLLAFTVALSIQQLAQQSFDFTSFGELAIQLRHQIQHHLP